MVNVAATTPPASHLDHGLPRANNKFFGTAKRKRTDQQVREDGQLLQNGAGHSTAVKPDLAGGKQTDEGTLERKQSRGRQPSLRHVKNSTEVLRQRSAKRENQSVALDSISAGREGRNFTVANVGNNGKIYLRPTPKSANQTPQPTQNALSQRASNASVQSNMKLRKDAPTQVQSSVWSETQTSRTPTGRARSIGRSTEKTAPTVRDPLRRSRTVSMSTVDTQIDITRSKTGDFKIAIDHADTPPKQPTLQVPIPHYRLGTPRFSTRGTAFLHSSVYTSNSTNEDTTASAFPRPDHDKMFSAPPGIGRHPTASQDVPESSPRIQSIQIRPVGDNTQTLAVTSSPAFHRAKEPIVPSIYDALSTNPDDPAIVRYVVGSREITAASPARIIAQVTSASFLDYELLSDFFLTVRAYLSTHDLLEYLLARFEWAINRLNDDGRVIRVRAFAALRHWILNYFPYDFVVDRDLRVNFCKRLNALMKDVRRRSSHAPSDLKLILDLKKCWNGRCALYWDGPLLDSEGLDNADIQPGGIAGSRDSQLTHPSQLWSKVSGVSPPHIEQGSDVDKSTAALNNWFEGIQKAATDAQGQQRHASATTTRSMQTSPTSEQSIQALSCTFPGLGLKKAAPYTQRSAVAHPVAQPEPSAPASKAERRVCPAAPSALANEPSQPSYGHKRSGSFSDAARDRRASLPSMNGDQPAPPIEMAYPYQGSLIRGAVIAPGSPYIDQFAPTSPVSEERSQFLADSDESEEDDNDDYDDDNESYSNSSSNRVVYSSHPGMKNIFGSIRRALSSKQVGQPPLSSVSADLSVPSVARSKSSMATSCKSAQKLNTLQRQLDASRQNARIDLLCADVSEMFQRALMQASEEDLHQSNASAIYRQNLAQWSPGHSLVHPGMSARNPSGVTTGSRSIPIVDDTGLDEPVPDIPPAFLTFAGTPHVSNGNVPYQQSYPAVSLLPSGDTKPSPLARLSNAVAIADRVLSVPVQATGPKTPVVDRQITSAGHATTRNEAEAFRAGLGPRTALPNEYAPAPSSYAKSPKSVQSKPRSLRKYASYQSSIYRHDSGRVHKAVEVGRTAPPVSLDTSSQTPGRMLRRRPGGDLRATENVHDLNKVPRRSRSVGSITTYSESLRGSGHTTHRLTRTTSSRKATAPEPPSPGPVDAHVEPVKRSVSLMRTHSSQAALRPSFEAALAEFARIPDEEGGDIEATLAKLEGKYRRHSPAQPSGPETVYVKGPKQASQGHGLTTAAAASEETKEPKKELEIGGGVSFPIPPDPQLAPRPRPTNKPDNEGDVDTRSNMTKSMYATSEESYDSTPVSVRRIRQNPGRQEAPKAGSSTESIPRPLFGPGLSATDQQADATPFTTEDEPDYFRRGARCRSSIPTTTDSFLLDEDEFLSDLSSELSDDTIEPDDDIDYPFGSAAQLVRNENRPPKIGYLLGYPTHPPTPPMAQETAKAITSQAKLSQDSRKPPTPDPSPVSLPVQPTAQKTAGVQAFSISTQNLSAHRHVPFVMSFDSGVIAQQFTIIERDALNEINWQDLIDMRWHHNSPSTLNWVDYLRTQDPTGIELVTARFNLTVKWVLSEVVLTQNVDERAMAIVKYIHVARHCRKNHNYATLFQLTIALTSVDISRLATTWELVPAADKKTLKELETLVTPIKNFHNLRQEMETTNSEEGCIPVIALYIHDLTYNSQKPSQVPSTREGEPLVNFERYRTTASIVKSLLRLIDASSKYNYQAVDNVLDKCLWMACLSDEAIRLKSKELE
ncbi:MAG: hypothetical protein L6R35_000072 [Caloplaca aegaea]|nr:MAG: hypothetical protein L6R35_000072 [Caloplaca aegaea]